MPAVRVSLWLPVAAWAAVIFALSSIPDLATDLGVWDTLLSTLAHLTEYAVLAFLLARALGREPVAAALASAYGVTDEFHQAFVSGRQASVLDWVVDTIGALAGVLLFARAVR